MIQRSEHSVHLERGLYELCKMRIAADDAFRAQAINRNFEDVNDAPFDEYRLWQIKKNLKWVYEKSSFYCKLFDAHGAKPDDFRTLADLEKFPFTFPTDLSGTSYSFLCTSQSEVEKPVTFYTSGSTGTKKRIFFSMADIQKSLDFLPRGMNTVVGKEEARCQVFLQNSQGRGIGSILAKSLVDFGMQSWTSDLADSVENIIKVTLDNKVNVWFGEAITILRATRILAQRMTLSELGIFIDGDQLYFDMEVLDVEKFDAGRLVEKFMELPELQGAKAPVINVLPCGALRKFCFEKKRIRPLETREL